MNPPVDFFSGSLFAYFSVFLTTLLWTTLEFRLR